ncbi:hypothetical protein [Jatrophihabitans sp. GAS493]|uniref:hypothetical protein n=1 Tax=Jatrophihabitans sp. GAS493 TaxID=1907575 RepID=UPI001F5301AD|nr:hypothetical protein [Jatrophihabitans sp. GAS493]
MSSRTGSDRVITGPLVTVVGVDPVRAALLGVGEVGGPVDGMTATGLAAETGGLGA